jgi:hypothetical protein
MSGSAPESPSESSAARVAALRARRRTAGLVRLDLWVPPDRVDRVLAAAQGLPALPPGLSPKAPSESLP